MKTWKAMLVGGMIFAAGAAFGQCADDCLKCPEVRVECPPCPEGSPCPECPPAPAVVCPDPCPDASPPCIEIPLTITPSSNPGYTWDVGVGALLFQDTTGFQATATWNGHRLRSVRPTFGVVWVDGYTEDYELPTQVRVGNYWKVMDRTRSLPISDQWGAVIGVSIGVGRR